MPSLQPSSQPSLAPSSSQIPTISDKPTVKESHPPSISVAPTNLPTVSPISSEPVQPPTDNKCKFVGCERTSLNLQECDGGPLVSVSILPYDCDTDSFKIAEVSSPSSTCTKWTCDENGSDSYSGDNYEELREQCLACFSPSNEPTAQPSLTPVQVSGIFFEDVNGNGVKDEEESLIIGDVTIRLYSVGNDPNGDGTVRTLVKVITSSDGSYSANMPPGKYQAKIVLSSPDYQLSPLISNPQVEDANSFDPSTSFTLPVDLQPGESATLNAGLFKSVTISGQVFFDADGNGIREPNEEGYPELATIKLYDRNSENPELPMFITVTGKDGKYYFPDIPPGKYYLEFVPADDNASVVFSLKKFGVDDCTDSDVDSEGRVSFTVVSGVDRTCLDAGLVTLPSSPSPSKNPTKANFISEMPSRPIDNPTPPTSPPNNQNSPSPINKNSRSAPKSTGSSQSPTVAKSNKMLFGKAEKEVSTSPSIAKSEKISKPPTDSLSKSSKSPTVGKTEKMSKSPTTGKAELKLFSKTEKISNNTPTATVGKAEKMSKPPTVSDDSVSKSSKSPTAGKTKKILFGKSEKGTDDTDTDSTAKSSKSPTVSKSSKSKSSKMTTNKKKKKKKRQRRKRRKRNKERNEYPWN